MACLVIGLAITGFTLRSALQGRRDAKLERQLAQTEWLCEGGVIRAVNALRASPEYGGESWQPTIDIEPLQSAVVEIKVQPATDAWQIEVTARLDSTADSDGPMQRSKSIVVRK